jgi:hypothetical protein
MIYKHHNTFQQQQSSTWLYNDGVVRVRQTPGEIVAEKLIAESREPPSRRWLKGHQDHPPMSRPECNRVHPQC